MARRAKMMIAGDRLILSNDRGSLIVAQVSDSGLKFLAQTKPFRRTGKDWTVPVLADGRLFCRSGREQTLVCFDVSQ